MVGPEGGLSLLEQPEDQARSDWRGSSRLDTATPAHKLVLLVQDDTDLKGVKVAGGRGGEWGEVLHTTLAVTPRGALLGIMDQRWFEHVAPVKGETQKQRAARWRESDVWRSAAQAIGGGGSAGCRHVHVADRASDNLLFMHACLKVGHGFVIRAKHDRRVEEQTATLWPRLEQEPVAGTLTAQIGLQRPKAGKPGHKSTPGHAVGALCRHQTDAPMESSHGCEALDGAGGVSQGKTHPPEGLSGGGLDAFDQRAGGRLSGCLCDRRTLPMPVGDRGMAPLPEGRVQPRANAGASSLGSLRQLSALLSVIAVHVVPATCLKSHRQSHRLKR